MPQNKPASPASRVFKFGPFELDARTGELRKHGVPIRLQEQPLRILLLLLERRGEVVLRTEVQEKLWPHGTMVDFGHGINAAVQRLRDALSETAGTPRYIETLARRGYRFVADVVIEGGAAEVADTPATLHDLVGRTIAHFRVIEKIGEGAMGVVYRAEDVKLGRGVALKVLAERLAASPKARKRFEHEARAASALNHPNVCIVYEVEEYNQQPVISMELLEGETLAAALKRGPLPMPQTLKLAIQLADALYAAHCKGIVHGDLKPENLLITAAGLKVLDFGLAEIGGTKAETSGVVDCEPAQSSSGPAGTPYYMSPEQTYGEHLTSRSDLFSFGLLVYEMVTGQRAIPDEDVGKAIRHIRHGEVDLASVTTQWLPILRNCLKRDPAVRPASIVDVKLDLERLVRRDRQPPRMWLAAVVAAGIAILGIAIVWVRLSPSVLVFTPQAPMPPPIIYYPQSPLVPTDRPAPQNGFTYRQISNSEPLEIEAPGGMGISRLSLSPDGRNIAFVAGGRILVRQLGRGDSVALAGTEGAGAPFWSPDGTNIAFVAGRRLKKIGPGSATPVTLGEIDTLFGGAWGGDNILIGAIGEGLFRFRPSGGERERLTIADRSKGEGRHIGPQFLPGNRRYIYVAAGSEEGTSMLYGASLDGGERQPIMPVESNVVFVPSKPGKDQGFLLHITGGALVAQPFDAKTMRAAAETFLVTDSIPTTGTQAAKLRLGDFSATQDVIAIRSNLRAALPVLRFEAAAMKSESSHITLIRNWMSKLGR